MVVPVSEDQQKVVLWDPEESNVKEKASALDKVGIWQIEHWIFQLRRVCKQDV